MDVTYMICTRVRRDTHRKRRRTARFEVKRPRNRKCSASFPVRFPYVIALYEMVTGHVVECLFNIPIRPPIHRIVAVEH